MTSNGHEHHHDHGAGHGAGHSHGPYDKNRNPVDFARYLGKLEDPEREAWQKPDRVVEALGLRAGDVACDVGAGPGYMALRMARAVGPTGAVYAIDVDPRMIEEIGQRIRATGIENVHPILSAGGRGGLPPRRCQVILIVNTFHHFPDGAAYLKKLAGRLAAGGRIVVVDFQRARLPVGPPPGHKISRVGGRRRGAAGRARGGAGAALPALPVLPGTGAGQGARAGSSGGAGAGEGAGGEEAATPSASTRSTTSRSTVHQVAGAFPPKHPQARSIPRASALASPTVNTASSPASTSAAARAQTFSTRAMPAAISTPTTAAATAGTSTGGTMR